jgi:hypothetical protein
MSDIKDDGSSEENEELGKRNQKRRAGEPLIRDRDMEAEERMRRQRKRLERTVMPEGVRGVRSGPTKKPAPPADFNHWARQDSWHSIDDGAMLIKGFEPVDVQAYWWPPGFEDILNIQETARTSIYAGRLREREHPRQFLAWAREKGYFIPKELEELVNLFHPEAEGRPQGDADRPKWPWGGHDTQLLRHLAAAGDRFWKYYDPSDPATAPTNKQVTDWLVEQGVARRNAEVMATVLRTDDLPPGPRK